MFVKVRSFYLMSGRITNSIFAVSIPPDKSLDTSDLNASASITQAIFVDKHTLVTLYN